MAGRPDPWADIDFEEIQDATCLEVDDIKVLFGCFQLFDVKKQDYLLAEEIDEVMRAMGFRPTEEELAELIEEIDEDGSGAIEFAEFAQLCAKFLVEDPDPETMRAELKTAFRLFDKDGSGFITMVQFRNIIAEVDPKLTESDLDAIIEEIDEDGSGTMDFEEFCEMMMTSPEVD
jgi:Ca2+-binding EF-hand superfamily protein